MKPEGKFAKFLGGLSSVVGHRVRVEVREHLDFDAMEVRIGNHACTVMHTQWTDDPYSSGQEVGRSLLGGQVQDDSDALKRDMDAALFPARTAQDTLDRLEAALDSLEAAVGLLRAATEELRG